MTLCFFCGYFQRNHTRYRFIQSRRLHHVHVPNPQQAHRQKPTENRISSYISLYLCHTHKEDEANALGSPHGAHPPRAEPPSRVMNARQPTPPSMAPPQLPAPRHRAPAMRCRKWVIRYPIALLYAGTPAAGLVSRGTLEVLMSHRMTAS